MSEQTPERLDHATFREQIATALAGGLSAAERSAFDAHASACVECAEELRRAREAEDRMTALFAGAMPVPGMEDRVIGRLRLGGSGRARRWLSPLPSIRLHPALAKASGAVAAAIVLGAIGYSVSQSLDSDQPAATHGKFAQSRRQIAQATSRNSNDFENLGYSVQTMYGDANGKWQRTWRDGGFTVKDSMQLGDFSGDGVVGAGFGEARQGQNRGEAATNTPFGVTTLGGLVHESSAVKTGAGTMTLSGGNTFGGETVVTNGTASSLSTSNADGSRRGPQDEAGTKEKGVDFFFQHAAEKSDSREWFKPTQLGRTGGSAQGAEGKDRGIAALGKNSEQLQRSQAVQKKLGEVEDLSQTVVAGKPMQTFRAGRLALADSDADQKKPATPPPATVIQRESESGQFPLLGANAGGPAPAPAAAPNEAPPTQPAATGRKVVRNGQVEFEVERFDSAFAQVSKLTQEAGGYVGTTDSEKLPNGKVKGTVTVRVPPDRLDTLILQLRGIGDLKSQKLEAQDVTRHYSDMDSELRAAKAMEERLLAIIKEGKGQIKDLLAAEKELGNWRTKVEQLVGEMKYYDSLVALSTLNITLFEKDIRTLATAYETETIDSGVEAEDVEKARAAALKAIEDAKGRVIQSDLKRYDAGQFGATIVADVPADAAGPMLDRLKQIGKMARLDVQRKQTAAENSATVGPLKVEKRDTRVNLSIYNLANVAPRQTVTLNVAAADVETAYRAILARVTKAGGRVVTSNLSRNKPEATTGTITFEIPAAEADAVANDVRAAGDVMKLSVSENPDVQNVTTAKRGFSVQLASSAVIPPRETATIQIAAADVKAAREKILAAASAGSAQVIQSQLSENDQQNVTATLELDIRRGEPLAAVEKAIAEAGQTISRSVARLTDTENTLDSKVKLSWTLGAAEKLAPREMTRLGVELSDVEGAVADLTDAANKAGGRVVESHLSADTQGRREAHVIVETPLDKAGEVIARARSAGALRAFESGKNLQVPAGPLARARIEVNFGTGDALVGPEKGIWASIRAGLSTSIAGLAISVRLIVVGLCFVLPWVLILFGGWRLWKRRRAVQPAISSSVT
jgi:autotransporter-associated beta strand protein